MPNADVAMPGSGGSWSAPAPALPEADAECKGWHGNKITDPRCELQPFEEASVKFLGIPHRWNFWLLLFNPDAGDSAGFSIRAHGI